MSDLLASLLAQQSVRLFGVVDVSNTLKENEVYLQVEGLGFITGDMIMFRDPWSVTSIYDHLILLTAHGPTQYPPW